jgi:hypothetical protein
MSEPVVRVSQGFFEPQLFEGVSAKLTEGRPALEQALRALRGLLLFPHPERKTNMSRLLVFAIGFVITTAVGAAQFSVDLWGVTYIAQKEDAADSAFRLDDNGCRKEVSVMVYADAAKGVDNKPVWTKAYLDCMEAKGYAMAQKRNE